MGAARRGELLQDLVEAAGRLGLVITPSATAVKKRTKSRVAVVVVNRKFSY